TPTAARNMTTKPSAQIAGDLPSSTKNEARTTRNPASGPTDRSIPPSKSAKVCPREIKPSAAQAYITELMLKSERYRWLRERTYAPSASMTAASTRTGAEAAY